MRQKRVCVTGGAGFIGHHLVRYLKNKGYWVRSVDIKHPIPAWYQDHDEFLELDLRHKNSALLATHDVDEVYALAADMGGMGFIAFNEVDILRNNALININTAEGCRLNKVKRVFFSSSACVYPEEKQITPEVVPLSEDMAYPANPDTEYGWEKLFSERIYAAYEKNGHFAARIARYHNIYGIEGTYKGGREKAPAALCRKVAEVDDGGIIEVWGDGEQTRSFCYVDDCLEGTYRLMNSDFTNPINIGSDHLLTINELADIIIGISGKKVGKQHDTTKPQGVRGRNSDNTLCALSLDWSPKISIEEGLKKTYEWIYKQIHEF